MFVTTKEKETEMQGLLFTAVFARVTGQQASGDSPISTLILPLESWDYSHALLCPFRKSHLFILCVYMCACTPWLVNESQGVNSFLPPCVSWKQNSGQTFYPLVCLTISSVWLYVVLGIQAQVHLLVL